MIDALKIIAVLFGVIFLLVLVCCNPYLYAGKEVKNHKGGRFKYFR